MSSTPTKEIDLTATEIVDNFKRIVNEIHIIKHTMIKLLGDVNNCMVYNETINAILEEGNCSSDCGYIDKTFEVDNPAEISLVLSVIIILFSVVTVYGSIAALRKSDFSMALIGSIAGILSYGFMLGSILSIVAMLMIFSDRYAFESVLNTKKENL